ncbi:MAG: polysaccharide biosynthesis C-terminal domain-containing protein [Bacteroidota bacterium]
MGLIARQSSKHFIVSILSMSVGIINNIFIYPKFFALYGFLQAFRSIGDLLLPCSMLGLNPVMVRFKHLLQKGKNNAFAFGLIWFFVSSSIALVVIYFSKNYIIEVFSGVFKNIVLLEDYNLEILIGIYLMGIATILTSVSLINNRIVVPAMLTNFVISKLGFPIIVIISSYFLYPNEGLIWLYLGLLTLLVLLLLGYTVKNKFVQFTKLKLTEFKKHKDEVFNFGLYSVLDSIGVKLAFGIDIIMINVLIGNEASGIYAVFLFLSRVVSFPLASIDKISNPSISGFWAKNELDKIKKLYQQSGITILTVSFGIFLLIYHSMDDILFIMKKVELVEAKFIFLFVAGAMVLNSITSVNSPILVYSKKYRWNLFFTLILALINVILTYYFITYIFEDPYKSAGAACSTAISLIVFNYLKMGFIYAQFKIHPFTKETFMVLGLGLATFVLFHYIPLFSTGWISMFVRSGLIALIYGGIVYYLKISPDLNAMINQQLLAVKNYIK